MLIRSIKNAPQSETIEKTLCYERHILVIHYILATTIVLIARPQRSTDRTAAS